MAMSASSKDPVLIVGGSGVVGSRAARTLRRLEPRLPIAIGGRDLAKAEAIAGEIGLATAARIDLDRRDLGLPGQGGQAFSAIAMFVKDDGLHAMNHAQSRGVPYLDISTGLFEIGPAVARYIHQPSAAPILLASHYLAGTVTLAALYFARELRTVQSIAIGAVLDEQDMGGPAAHADYQRYMTASPNALLLADGKWRWVGGDDATRRFETVDGTEVQAQAYGVLDVVSLAAATGARSVRLDLALGQTASRRRGERFSTEVVIETEGEQRDGSPTRVRHELVHSDGQAPMTALGVAMGLQRLLGLAGGPPVAPGLYFPDAILDPESMVQRLRELGTSIRRVRRTEEG
jgi:hypothetical protein